jgi:hypothetical protein
MWIFGVETRKEGLPGEMGEGLERGEKGAGIWVRRCVRRCVRR